MQAALVEEGLAPATSLSFVGSLAVFFIAFLALINARIIRALGARNTGLLGIAFLGGSEVLSGFATKSLPGLFVTSGVGMGIGTSLCFMVVSVTPAQWFNKRRGLSNGVVYAAGGLGGTCLAFLFDALIQKLGTAWAFHITGLLTLATGLPAAWMIKERSPIRAASFIEWRLFRDPTFTLLFFAAAISCFVLFVPPFFLPLYVHSLGLSSSVGSAVVAGFNFSSAVGRLGCGFMCDRIGAVNTLLFSLVISAGSMLVLWPLSNSIGPLVAFAIINGVGNGGFFSTIPSVVSQVFGSARLGTAMAMVVTGWAGGYLLGAPIAGYLLAAFGGQDSGLHAYLPAIMYAGGMALVSGTLVAIARFRMDRTVFKKL